MISAPQPYYRDDDVTIYQGDCSEIVPIIGRVDALVTDPPYGIGMTGAVDERRNRTRKVAVSAKTDYGAHNWDDFKPSDDTMATLLRMSNHQIIFGGNHFALPATTCLLVWLKETVGNFAPCEIAWTNFSIAHRVLTYRWSGFVQEKPGEQRDYRVHPTQKPLAVMEWAISLLPIKTGVILDPFMGSGTTLIAARKLGYKAIGIDQAGRYCELAKKRLTGEIGLTVGQERALQRKNAGQMSLFEKEGK